MRPGSVPFPMTTEVAGALRVAVGMVMRKLRQAPPRASSRSPSPRRCPGWSAAGPATSSDLARQDRISPQSMGVTVAAL